MADTVRKRPGAVAMLPVTKLVTLCQDHFAQPKRTEPPHRGGRRPDGAVCGLDRRIGRWMKCRVCTLCRRSSLPRYSARRGANHRLLSPWRLVRVSGETLPLLVHPVKGSATRKRVGASDNSDGLEGSAASLMTTGCTRSRAG